MKIEHFALNVSDPIAISKWYCEHLGFTIALENKEAPFMHLLKDESGTVMIEFYNNSAAPVPNYTEQDPLVVHIAFVSINPVEDKDRLVEAGCSVVIEQKFDDGSHLFMMRDPWGLAIQLCKRGAPVI